MVSDILDHSLYLSAIETLCDTDTELNTACLLKFCPTYDTWFSKYRIKLIVVCLWQMPQKPRFQYFKSTVKPVLETTCIK